MTPRRPFTVEEAIALVAAHYDMPPLDLVGPKRTRYVAMPRQMVMWLCSQGPLSQREIGAALGRDRTTVLYGIREMQRRIDEDPELDATARTILEQLRPGQPRKERPMPGGPAFPLIVPPNDQWSEIERGMSLRAYLAGQAIQGLLAHRGVVMGGKETEKDIMVRDSCLIADALITELEKAAIDITTPPA